MKRDEDTTPFIIPEHHQPHDDAKHDSSKDRDRSFSHQFHSLCRYFSDEPRVFLKHSRISLALLAFFVLAGLISLPSIWTRLNAAPYLCKKDGIVMRCPSVKETSSLWENPYSATTSWKPCAERHADEFSNLPPENETTGNVFIHAEGGLNQHRIAEIEDLYHVLFGCDWAKHLWPLSDLPLTWEGVNNTIWDSLKIIDKTDELIIGERNRVWLSACIFMYSFWYVRNSARLKKNQLQPLGFLALVRNLKQKWVCQTDYSATDSEFRELPHPAPSGNQRLQSPVQFSDVYESWYMHKPPPGWVILLTDAAYSLVDGSAAFGAVLVNNSGRIIGTKSKLHAKEISQGAEEAELLAVEHGLDWVSSLLLTNVVTFSDCLNVIEGLQQKREFHWKLQPVLHHIINNHAWRCVFSFIPRKLNQSARFLAKKCLNLKQSSCNMLDCCMSFCDFSFVE